MSDALPHPRTVLRAALGFLTFGAWLFLVGAQALVGIGELIVSFAIAVVVPLGLRATRGEGDLAYERVQRVVGLSAPVGMVAFAFPPGRTSAALSAVWLAATLAVAARGLVRVRARGFFPLDELAIDLGHLLLPVGGAWLFASRAGMSPFGFFEPIVLYTAALRNNYRSPANTLRLVSIKADGLTFINHHIYYRIISGLSQAQFKIYLILPASPKIQKRSLT